MSLAVFFVLIQLSESAYICESVDVIDQNKCSLHVYSNTVIINLARVTALNSEIEWLDELT